jgi:hypothetical protein
MTAIYPSFNRPARFLGPPLGEGLHSSSGARLRRVWLGLTRPRFGNRHPAARRWDGGVRGVCTGSPGLPSCSSFS